MELTNFDPEISAESVKQKLQLRQKVTIEIVSELYKAKEFYSNSGFRSDLRTNVQRLNTFGDYLSWIGLHRRTSDRWLERYIPEENKLISWDELQKIKQQEKIEIQKEEIKNFDNESFQKRKDEAFNNISQQTKKTNYDDVDNLLNDLQSAIDQNTAKEEKLKKIRVSNNSEIIDQDIWFESIRDYLYQYDNVNRRLEVIQNFIKYLKDLGIECQRIINDNKLA